MGQREVGIEVDRPGEIGYGPPGALRGELVQQVPRREIGIVGRYVAGEIGGSHDGISLPPDSQYARQGLLDLVLDREEIRGLTLVGLGPEIEALIHVHQLGRDPEAISGPQNAALQHGADTKLPSDEARFLSGLPQSEGRRAGRHPQTR
jgi:hypothetical protein